MDQIAFRLAILVALLVAAGFFSGSETALFSLSRVQRERLARAPSSTDRYIVTLLRDPRRLIVTLMLGNELVNIAFSSVALGVVEKLFPKLGPISLIGVTTLITVPLLLMIGEITPKSIALRIAETWARGVARVVGFFALLVTPVRLILNAVAGVIVRVFGGGASAVGKGIGEAEFKALVDASSEEGTLQASERRLIHNVFEFGETSVAEIMTPAREMFSLSFDLPLHRLISEVARGKYSRIPIHRGRKEEIVGILYAKDLVGGSLGKLTNRTVKDLLRPPMYVPKTTKCDRLFRDFQRKRTHLALVVDEYGRQVGLATMEDLLTELFGETAEEKRDSSQIAAVSGDGADTDAEPTPPPEGQP
jgi:putative hemolysin